MRLEILPAVPGDGVPVFSDRPGWVKKMAGKKSKKKIPPAAGRGPFKWAFPVAAGLFLVLMLGMELAKVLNAPQPDVFIPANFIGKISGSTLACGKFNAWDASPAGEGRIAVTDAERSRVLFFDRSGKFLSQWGKREEGPQALKEPSGIVSDGEGNVFFVDAWQSVLTGLNPSTKPILSAPLTQGFYGSRGLAFDGKSFYVADTGAHRVVQLTQEGNFVTYWGGKMGSGSDQLNDPYALTYYGGNLYVADTNNHRIQVLDPSGKGRFVKTLKLEGPPSDVVFDAQGRLFVSQLENGAVEVFNSNGKILGKLKDEKGSPDSFRNVNGLGMTSDGTLLLASGDNVLLYRVP